MAFGLQVETVSGVQDITTLRSMRLIQTYYLSGGSGSGALPAGCTPSNSFPFVAKTTSGAVPWVIFLSNGTYYFENGWDSSAFTMHVVRFT